jgi:hypothetical protein
VVALVHPQAAASQPYEVADLFEVPLFLLNPATTSATAMSGRAWSANGLPCPIRMASSSVHLGRHGGHVAQFYRFWWLETASPGDGLSSAPRHDEA